MGQNTDRVCVQCGKTIRGRTSRLCGQCNAHPCESCGRVFPGYGRYCNACRTKERTCTDCGKTFRGRETACPACRAKERECESCGKIFRGVLRRCLDCRVTTRTCLGCGKTYEGRQDRCRSCRTTERTCEACGSTFRGDMKTCRTCQGTERICAGCGERFIGAATNCWRCNAGQKPCAGCGRLIRSPALLCSACRTSDRTCITCGKTFRGRTVECKVCSGQARADSHARRARKLAAEVAGPLPRSVYQKVIASGPCVYCSAPATSVDHVRPLARGGHEAEYNLVPACGSCNSSKHDRLLTDWDPVRVAHAAACSPAVAAELKRELDDAAQSGVVLPDRPRSVPGTLEIDRAADGTVN